MKQKEQPCPVDKTLTPVNARQRGYVFVCDAFPEFLRENRELVATLAAEGCVVGRGQPGEERRRPGALPATAARSFVGSGPPTPAPGGHKPKCPDAWARSETFSSGPSYRGGVPVEEAEGDGAAGDHRTL